MNQSGDAAEEVVRMSLEGVEVAAKISGEGAKYVAVNLIAALRSEQKTRGKARLSSMLKSGKPLKVYEVRQEDLKMFAKEAKRYGVLYCVLKDKTGKSETVDVISRVEDASKIQRITERFKLAAINTADVKSDVTRSRMLPDRGVKHEEKGSMDVPERGTGEAGSNPTSAQTGKDGLSAPGSKQTGRSNGSTRPCGKDVYRDGKQSGRNERPSVREKLAQYRRSYERSKAERSRETEQGVLPEVTGKPPKLSKPKER